MATENTETETRRGRKRTVSDAALKRARELYDNGMSVPKIARQAWCKIGVSALYYHLKGSSPHSTEDTEALEMRGKGRKGPSTEQAALIVSSYLDGMNIDEIRNLPGLKWKEKRKVRGEDREDSRVRRFSRPTVSKVLHEAGVHVRRGRPALPQEEEAAE